MKGNILKGLELDYFGLVGAYSYKIPTLNDFLTHLVWGKSSVPDESVFSVSTEKYSSLGNNSFPRKWLALIPGPWGAIKRGMMRELDYFLHLVIYMCNTHTCTIFCLSMRADKCTTRQRPFPTFSTTSVTMLQIR